VVVVSLKQHIKTSFLPRENGAACLYSRYVHEACSLHGCNSLETLSRQSEKPGGER
jgi:hypothetical protein